MRNRLAGLVLMVILLACRTRVFALATVSNEENEGLRLYAEGKKLLARGEKEGQFETVSNAIEYLRKANEVGVDSRLELGQALFWEDLLWNRQSKSKQLKAANESFLLAAPGRTRIGVLLLHDLGSAPLEMRELGELLYQNGITVYAPRLAGHGLRPDALRNVGPTEWRKDYLLGYEILKLMADKIYVVGSGLGGVLALELAIKEKVSGIVTLNVALDFPGMGKYLLFLSQYTGLSTKLLYPPAPREFSYEYVPLKTYNQAFNIAAYVKTRLGEVSEPLAIFQSRTDKLVNARGAEIVYDAVKSKEKKIFWFQKAGHQLLSRDNPGRQLALNEIWRFISRNF